MCNAAESYEERKAARESLIKNLEDADKLVAQLTSSSTVLLDVSTSTGKDHVVSQDNHAERAMAHDRGDWAGLTSFADLFETYKVDAERAMARESSRQRQARRVGRGRKELSIRSRMAAEKSAMLEHASPSAGAVLLRAQEQPTTKIRKTGTTTFASVTGFLSSARGGPVSASPMRIHCLLHSLC